MSGARCRTLYPFSGERHGQGLRFAAGELITLLQVPDGGWWEGEKEDGLRGWFPASYVQLLEKPGMVPPPPGEESQTVVLPPGWQSYLSPQGRRYYVNTATNETTWERPSSSPGIPASPGPHRSSLPLTVNGHHTPGTPTLPPETAHMSVRKSAGDSQNLGSSSPGKKQSKENTITINCVTFPHPDTMPEQQLLKPTEWSYCDYFWADKKDPQGNGTMAGFELLLQKQLKGKQMQKEMSEFIRERIKIEEEYAKNLAKLSQNSLAAQEEGAALEEASTSSAWAAARDTPANTHGICSQLHEPGVSPRHHAVHTCSPKHGAARHTLTFLHRRCSRATRPGTRTPSPLRARTTPRHTLLPEARGPAPTHNLQPHCFAFTHSFARQPVQLKLSKRDAGA
ncbi:growth arrest-specific protein 7 isoform X3 [Balaenoptera acutorostrata]|uniref:Growth arrest-specific protein 7 isoform X3 n=1 Tax=Balaenoptera acutorostrata TaxID=9767 RepID=A0ABM3SQJ5_BALAC|nr:growth arrest-specific protein 7 isoform X3 [Balaenoptera acutorostrata]